MQCTLPTPFVFFIFFWCHYLWLPASKIHWELIKVHKIAYKMTKNCLRGWRRGRVRRKKWGKSAMAVGGIDAPARDKEFCAHCSSCTYSVTLWSVLIIQCSVMVCRRWGIWKCNVMVDSSDTHSLFTAELVHMAWNFTLWYRTTESFKYFDFIREPRPYFHLDTIRMLDVAPRFYIQVNLCEIRPNSMVPRYVYFGKLVCDVAFCLGFNVKNESNSSFPCADFHGTVQRSRSRSRLSDATRRTPSRLPTIK